MSEADAQIRRWRRQKRAERARAMSEDRLTLEAGGIDEVVVDGCLAHLERLDTGHYFLCLSKPDGSELAFDAARAKTARHDDTIILTELFYFLSVTFEFDRVDPVQLQFTVSPKCRVFECFNNRNIYIRKLKLTSFKIFTNHSNL